jgi:ATP-dependent Clp protease ATP-binding subunit ClpA
VFERFSERARQVVVLAQEEARALKHNYIGTEHLLLGLIREEEGIAAVVLDSLGVGLEESRAAVRRIVGEGDEVPAGNVPFTPRSKKVLELALREALALGHNYIGTEHVLLGLVREADGVGAQILKEQVGDLDTVRNAVTERVTAVRPFPPGRLRRRPRTWAYKVEDLPDGPITDDWLGPFGSDGWELVAVVERRAVFKRPAR